MLGRRSWRFAAIQIAVCLALVGLPELLAGVLLHFPDALEGDALRVFRRYYSRWDRRIIQFLPECAAYDPELTYLLAPPGCRVRNREHVIDYAINRLGVRDDEASLHGPELIVLGDSHAMGWGVRQSESFPQVLERDSGRKVLNLAISSYGTVRQLKLLGRADTSRLETLIIQYCRNDWRENRTFEQQGDSLPVSDRRTYEEAVEAHLADSAYYPWKHTLRLAQIWRSLEPPRPLPTRPEARAAEARAFLNALATAGPEIGPVQILVLEINGWARNDPQFAVALERAAERLPPETPWRVRVVDLASLLTAETYYLLDDHLNADGHRAVAEALLPLL